MEEHSPEKAAEAPSLRASKKSAATSMLTRRSARLKGNLPEFGLYEKPTRTRKSVSKLSPLEISEERDSISSIPSSAGSAASKREAEDEPDLSPQSLIPPKSTAMPSPSVAERKNPGRIPPGSEYPVLREHQDWDESNQDTGVYPSPVPLVEYPGDHDSSEENLQILTRFSDRACEDSLVLHQQGFENLLVEQRLAQATAYQRYMGMVETERNELRLENQEIRVFVTRILDQSRDNEETRIKAFNESLVRLEENFSNQLESRVVAIRESFERQWADRETEIRIRASNSLLDSAEFQIAVENAIMAERQTLQNRLLRSEVEKEEVAKQLERTRSDLALSVNRIRIMEDDGQNFRQRLSDMNAEKEGLLRSLTTLQHQGRDLQIRAQDQHRDEMTRIRVNHQFDLERTRKEVEDENALLRAAHVKEVEEIRAETETQISKIRAESKSASVESGSEVARLTEANQQLLNEIARLELQRKDDETERQELQRNLEEQEAAYLELEDELRIAKSQHEQDFRQAYEDYQKQIHGSKEPGSGHQEEILVTEINRLKQLISAHENQAQEQAATIEHLEVSVQTKSRLIYDLETSLKRRVSPRGQPGLPCQICPSIQRELLEARNRIRTMTDQHADDLSTRTADLESRWKSAEADWLHEKSELIGKLQQQSALVLQADQQARSLEAAVIRAKQETDHRNSDLRRVQLEALTRTTELEDCRKDQDRLRKQQVSLQQQLEEMSANYERVNRQADQLMKTLQDQSARRNEAVRSCGVRPARPSIDNAWTEFEGPPDSPTASTQLEPGSLPRLRKNHGANSLSTCGNPDRIKPSAEATGNPNGHYRVYDADTDHDCSSDDERPCKPKPGYCRGERPLKPRSESGGS